MAYYDSYGAFPRYVPVAERRKKLEKRGRVLEPVRLEGKRIAGSFWGKEWCRNLESYMDFSNRLPRGRTYLRSGAVVDLRVGPGQIDALVAGGSLYEVSVQIDKLVRKRWARLETKPELFFTLRSVALEELVTKSALRRAGPAKDPLGRRALEEIFGIELDSGPRRRRR
jgi:hypothetical protein